MKRMRFIGMLCTLAVVLMSCDFFGGSKPKTYNIEFDLNGGEWKEAFKIPKEYTEGEELLLPDAKDVEKVDYEFMGWYENSDFNGNQVVSITDESVGTKKFYAKWKAIDYYIEYELNSGNWAAGYSAPGTYNIESGVILPIDMQVSRSGWKFAGWFDKSDFNGACVTSIEKGTTGNKKYYAKWNEIEIVQSQISQTQIPSNATESSQNITPEYFISLASGISNGTITPSSYRAMAGTTVSLNIAPYSGYRLDSITVTSSDGVSISLTDLGSTKSFVMPAKNVVLNASFTIIDYNITISSAITNGTVTTDITTAHIGDIVTLTITPDNGYQLGSVSASTGSTSLQLTSAGNIRTFRMPAGNVSINASFTAIDYSVVISQSIINGNITANKTTAHIGDVVTLTITPNNGYELGAISASVGSSAVQLSGTGNTRTFTMPAGNVLVGSSFSAIDYAVIISSEITNGTIQANKVTAHFGDTITLDVTPAVGYGINTISVTTETTEVILSGTGNTKTFSMPAGNVTVNVTFGITYTLLPSGTDGTAGQVATYVMFGKWPQTKKTDNTITINESDSKSVGDYTYYKGSDNEWYAKVGNDYYKVEPIKWRILNPNATGTEKKMLLAENVLINRLFYNYGEINRTIGGETIKPNNYEHSCIRAYLNGLGYQKKSSNSTEQEEDTTFVGKGFLYTAFTEVERGVIATTLVDNGTNYRSTSDKLFLLSVEEVTKAEFGFDTNAAADVEGNARLRHPTDFAKGNGALEDQAPNGGSWWLRTPDNTDRRYAHLVSYNSHVQIGSLGSSHGGVLPALCLE
ncbi:MAG: DUF6273 domain-containing protein [Parasporobacterium sp.]|nr:DUF6273 domain-containing protein [Parasporobacterium sp.]